ncbi:MAG: ABC transporter ATP-binding protein/permease [bacterium]
MTKSPLPWLAGLLALYLAAPLGALAVHLGTSGWAGLETPGLFAALEVSAGAATVSCAIIAAAGIPLGYVLAHGRGGGIGLLGSVVQLPLAMPPLAAGILLLFLVGPYTLIGRLTGGALTDSFAGIVLAQTFVASPFLVVAARSAFATMDPSLEGVAATLGHRPWARFWRVSLPVAWPGIRSGLLLAWVRAFGEFGATAMVAYHPYSLPVYTYVQFGSTGLTTTLAPVLLAVLVALVFLSLSAWQARARPRIAVHRLPASRHPAVLAAEPAGPPLRFALRKQLDAFHLEVAHTAATRRLAIVGPSGSGKTLTLRLLAGLDVPDDGTVHFEGIPLHTLPAEARRLGYVPQEYGLFPHLTVWQQLTFGTGADRGIARYWMDRLGLDGLEHRLPAQLSMGQRQRVALGRALVVSPRLLLLDEPFSALDAPVREAVRRDMRALQRETGMASLLVTHDSSEAAFLADELLVVAEGRVLQAGSVRTVFGHPASARIARLLGVPNVHDGRIVAPGVIEAASVRLPVANGARRQGQRVTWCVRPEDIQVASDGALGAVVRDVVDLGGTREVLVAVDGHVELRLRTTAELTVGSTCRLTIPPDAVTAWTDDTNP